MSRIPYIHTDAAVEKITKKISKQFRHNRLALFDEMNVLEVKKHVKKLYKRIYKNIMEEFSEILEVVSKEAYDEAVALGFDGDIKTLDEGWIEDFFKEYNPVTKYVFSNELGRKEERLFEALIAMMQDKGIAYKTAENLLIRQVRQSGIDLEDAIVQETYESVGVEQVVWVAELDNRTCGTCVDLDGEIFDIDKVPPKPHINCRCSIYPYVED